VGKYKGKDRLVDLGVDGRINFKKCRKGDVFSVHTKKTYVESRGIAPLIINLGNGWSLVMNFMARPLSAVK
jgi:hypothetical protein